MLSGILFSSVGLRLRVAFFLATLPPLRPAPAGIPNIPSLKDLAFASRDYTETTGGS